MHFSNVTKLLNICQYPVYVLILASPLISDNYSFAQSANSETGLATPSTVELETIAEIMANHRSVSVRSGLIRVRGVVSSLGDGIVAREEDSKASKSFCIEQDSIGIWVRSRQAIEEKLLSDKSMLSKLSIGSYIELEGYIEEGGFAPIILPTRVAILGQKKLPEAVVPDIREFLNGAYVMQRVTVGGVVQNITSENTRWQLVRIETGVGLFLTRVPNEKEFAPESLLDAEVELTGVAAVARNWRSQFLTPRIILDHKEDIKVTKAPDSDPFSSRIISLDNLDAFSIDGRPLHRLCIEATVTYYDGHKTMYVEDKELGVRVQTNDPVIVSVGDRVKVAGFIDTTRYLRGLRGATVMVVSENDEVDLVDPELVTIAHVFEDHYKSQEWKQVAHKTFDGRLVRMRGTVLSFQEATSREPNRLEIQDDEVISIAYVKGRPMPIPVGAEVELTGVAVMTYAVQDAIANYAPPIRVDLQLRGVEDIEILKQPSWWTAKRTMTTLFVVLGLGLAALVWAISLGRTVRLQTHQIAAQISERRDTAIEFQGAIRERTRLAADLHDTVLQSIAGVAYQIEACGNNMTHCPEARSHLDVASRMIQRGQDDLRRVVWALNFLPLEQSTFHDSVKQIVKRVVVDTSMVKIDCDANFPRLADFVAGNLLLLIQEAIHNSIKHSQADEIKIHLGWQPADSHVGITVCDNGNGFVLDDIPQSSDAHFGLEGMQMRVDRLDGEFSIESSSSGTKVIARVPLKEFDSDIA